MGDMAELEAPMDIEAPAGSGPPDYSGPDQRCGTCKNFDGDSQCQKFDAAVEDGGHCKTWEGASGDEFEVPDVEELPE